MCVCNYHPCCRLGHNQSVGSSVPVVSRWLGPGNRTFVEMASMVVTGWLVAFFAVKPIATARPSVKACQQTWCTETTNDCARSVYVVSRGAVRSAVSSYAAMRKVAGLRPVLVIALEWHIGLVLLCGCSGALEYPTTNSCRPINKSL